MIEVIENKSVVSSTIIEATDGSGNTVQVASLYGAVELDKSVSYSFTILNAALYNANKTEVQSCVTSFVAELQDKIEELGGLTFE